jgi:hypothetical protein
MRALIKALIAIDILETYLEDSFFDEMSHITIDLLETLSKLLIRDVKTDQPYMFTYKNQVLCVYNYIPEKHTDINLIYSITNIPENI